MWKLRCTSPPAAFRKFLERRNSISWCSLHGSVCCAFATMAARLGANQSSWRNRVMLHSFRPQNVSGKSGLMIPRRKQFEYRAWPSGGMPHVEALYHIFGPGVAEIRTDTYILSPSRPEWLMVVRGGTRFEIRVKIGEQEPVSAWKNLLKSDFPLRRSLVRTIQGAFPTAELPDRISAPGDLLSWVGQDASILDVSKRLVHFERGNCAAVLAQVETHGCSAETFCLKAKRYEPLIAALEMMPGPRLPNLHYGSWLQRSVLGMPPAPITEDAHKAERALSWRAAFLALPVGLKGPANAIRR